MLDQRHINRNLLKVDIQFDDTARPVWSARSCMTSCVFKPSTLRLLCLLSTKSCITWRNLLSCWPKEGFVVVGIALIHQSSSAYSCHYFYSRRGNSRLDVRNVHQTFLPWVLVDLAVIEAKCFLLPAVGSPSLSRDIKGFSMQGMVLSLLLASP